MPPSRRTLLGAVAATVPLQLAGCQGDQSSTTGATETTTTGTTATSRTTESATATATTTSVASVDIEPESRTVALGDDKVAMLRLDFTVTGGTVAETSWEAIELPDGSTAGFAIYDEYAQFRITSPGEYVVQLTATFESGALARDTTTITATAPETTGTTGE